MNKTSTYRMGKMGLVTVLACLGFSEVALGHGAFSPPLAETALSFELDPAAQEAVAVSGKVTDMDGEPIPGVNIMIKGTTVGTVTDMDGNYSLSVPDEGATLVFSFIGFLTEEIYVGTQTTINVSLVPDIKTLDELVVVGYGTQKRSEVVGAVAHVTIDEQISSRAMANVSSGLSGLVPGLTAIQSTGMAGRNQADLIIRGLGSVNSSSPLIVVDGMPDVDINKIDMNDVESVSVLKDAASAAVYGSRGANGVILITTKSGSNKDATITFSSTTAIESPTKGHNFMADYPRALTVQQRAASTNSLPETMTFKNGTIDEWMAMGMVDPIAFPNTDWFDITSRTGILQRHNLSASGGNDLSKFYISVGMLDQQGIQLNNDYSQFNARINYDYKLRKNMNVGVKLYGNSSDFTYSLSSGVTEGGIQSVWDGDGMRFAVAGVLPYHPGTGRYGGVMAYGEDPQAFQPYSVIMNNRTKQERQEGNGNIYFDWSPIKGLTAAVNYYLSLYHQFNSYAPMPTRSFNFQTGLDGAREFVSVNAGIDNYLRSGHKNMFTGQLNYEFNIGENHNIKVLGVYSEEYWFLRYHEASRMDRVHPTLEELDAALPDNQRNRGYTQEEGLRSVIGRVNYSAYDKYLLEANFRYDGSSKFLSGSQYGFFPSVAVGWRFIEEDFVKSFTGNVLSDGKLRASYGGLGNNAGIGRYEQQEVLTTNNYIIDGETAKGFVYDRMVNRNLSWEATEVLNIGLDLGFLNNRLTTELDYYDRLTTGMLLESNLSTHLTGAYRSPRQNIGNLRNKGVEANLTWRDQVRELQYTVNLNASYNRSSLEQWSDFIRRGEEWQGNRVFLDMPLDYLYHYEDIGIAQTWQDVYDATPQGAAPGDILFKDLNGDGRIDDNDRKADPNIQDSRPTTTFAMNMNFAWKGFDLTVFLQGSAGRKDYWLNNYKNLNIASSRHASTWEYWNNPWAVDNRDGGWPRLNGNGSNNRQTTFWLDDMSYLRLKNVQLGYNVPQPILSRLMIKNLRVFASAENLATFTSYRGLDPEKAGSANDLFPLLKSYSFGVNLTF